MIMTLNQQQLLFMVVIMSDRILDKDSNSIVVYRRRTPNSVVQNKNITKRLVANIASGCGDWCRLGVTLQCHN